MSPGNISHSKATVYHSETTSKQQPIGGNVIIWQMMNGEKWKLMDELPCVGAENYSGMNLKCLKVY